MPYYLSTSPVKEIIWFTTRRTLLLAGDNFNLNLGKIQTICYPDRKPGMQQLDIFADSESVQRTNDLMAAWARFDSNGAQLALQALRNVDAAHPELADFKTVCEYLARWPTGCDDPSWPRTPTAIQTAVDQLLTQLIPLTKKMGNAGHTLLRKMWADLANASTVANIDYTDGLTYTAELHWHAEQYAEMVRTAQQVPDADMQAPVQRWLALGHQKCGDHKMARLAALRFAWLAPQQFDMLITEINNLKLTKDWKAFQNDLGDLDATWFPIWCLHEHKADGLNLAPYPQNSGAMAYPILIDLIAQERVGLSEAIFTDRARLKDLGEHFFAFYLQRRSDFHSSRRKSTCGNP